MQFHKSRTVKRFLSIGRHADIINFKHLNFTAHSKRIECGILFEANLIMHWQNFLAICC